ncbi:MAG TPA: transglutaminase-like cysteine peptidase [Beijerinckiaceae bacterium]|nr:transglutaminase-like cysteine peptidase [Beijerinckiaceae bacterium]
MGQALFGRLSQCARLAARSRSIASLGTILGFGLLALGGAGGAAAQTLAALPIARSIEHIGVARPVLGWVKFCERHPDECRVDADEPAVAAITPQVWRSIVLTNRRVNARIKPKTDTAHWGVVDSWDFPDDGYGDCEDYQLLKRKLLAEQGLPRRAMRMTVVIDEQGEGHAVLMVRTDRGDFILDNKTNAVLAWNQTGYVFVKREGQEDAAWASLGGLTSPTTTANR